VVVLERGWLSANNTVLLGRNGAAVIDTGYVRHAEQTVALVHNTLGNLPLTHIANTHLHSDHCGGNAALQQVWPDVCTAVAPGQAHHVQPWNADALGYTACGQDCAPFGWDALLQPGSTYALAGQEWEVHAAPGHDPHAVLLLEPASSVLVSGDALWGNGFGVVFPELEGAGAFDAVSATLDVLEALAPRAVVPGHGPVFDDVPQALSRARRKLDRFARHPEQHALYAAKVLLKFKLLDCQQAPLLALTRWVTNTPYMALLHRSYFADQTPAQWVNMLAKALETSGAAQQHGDVLHNA
jgi:glyoxylase-like metal-dependent hydrolase (beta-lactamase superfamily II)